MKHIFHIVYHFVDKVLHLLAYFCVTEYLYVLPIDSSANQSPRTQSRRPVRGRKIVITTGRSSRHDAVTRPSTLPPRGRQACRQSGRQSRRGCGSRQQAASMPVTTADVKLDDDEWEVDDAEKIPQESTNERRDRLTSTVPRHTTQHGAIQDQIDSGSLLHFILSS